MFVGETGVQRIVKRTCELMKQDPNGDARAQGGIDLPTIQKYLNLWYSLSLDLFGGEISSNAADVLRDRPQGPLQGGPATRTTSALGSHLRDGRPRGRQGRRTRTSRCATR